MLVTWRHGWTGRLVRKVLGREAVQVKSIEQWGNFIDSVVRVIYLTLKIYGRLW